MVMMTAKSIKNALSWFWPLWPPLIVLICILAKGGGGESPRRPRSSPFRRHQ